MDTIRAAHAAVPTPRAGNRWPLQARPEGGTSAHEARLGPRSRDAGEIGFALPAVRSDHTATTPPTSLDPGLRAMTAPLRRRLLAEYLGSALLAALVLGSGIAAQTLTEDIGLRLLENAAATAAGLFAIILMFGPISGGHFNPVVSLVDAHFGGLSWRDAGAYIPAQIAGCISGALLANGMFGRAAVSFSQTHRATGPHMLAEAVATVGLLLVIFALARSGRGATAPAAVGAYIGAAYWFTSSTSFANPAITIGRGFSDSFAGIAPASMPAYVAAQLAGGLLAAVLIRALYPDLTAAEAADAVTPMEARSA